MSDVGILNGPGGVIFILLIFGSRGFVLGVILGALSWRRHLTPAPFWARLSALLYGWWDAWLSKA